MLKDGHVDLDLLHMTLRRTSTQSLDYEGPGRIATDERGAIRFTLYDTQRPAQPIHVAGGLLGGRWLTDDDVCDLQALDIRGRGWKASRLIVNASGPGNQPGAVCTGQVDELVHANHFEGARDYTWIALSGQTQLPYDATEWTTEDEVYKLAISADPRCTMVCILPKEVPLPLEIHRRIEETHFASTGRLSHWFLLAEQRAGAYTLRVRRRPAEPPKSRLHHPIAEHISSLNQEFAAFVGRYLGYIWNDNHQRYHPVSTRLYQVFRSGSIGIFSESASLCTAIEHIAKRFFAGLSQRNPSHESDVQLIRDAVAVTKTSADVRSRVDRWLADMLAPTAADVLRELVKRGVLTHQEFKRWKRIRNKVAHGEELNERYIGLADDNSALLCTLFKLVMQLIGYDGKYIGWKKGRQDIDTFEPSTLDV